MQLEQTLQILLLRIRSLIRARQLDAELQEELQFHIDQKARQLVATGLAPNDAQREAIRAVAHLEQCKEECRDARGVRFIQETWRDVRFGTRLLRKSPGFTATAVAMLAIAIGASATVYSFANTLLLKPMPYGTPEGRLFLLWERFAAQQLERVAFSTPEVAELQQNISAFDQVAAFRHTEFNLVGADEPERIHAAAASWNLFSLLDVAPLLGRTFSLDDQDDNSPPIVIISESLWKRDFASDPDLVGRQIVLSGRPHTVVGIMPSSFHFPPALFDVRGPFPSTVEIWKPIKNSELSAGDRSFRIYGVIARSRPGTKQEVITGELSKLSRRWERQYPNAYIGRGFDLSAHPLRNEMIARVWPPLLISAIAVCLLLLIAVANLIALLLSRANARERELTMRIALGAPPARLWRQLVTEGLLLAFLGGAVGLLIATSATVLSRTVFGHGIPLLGEMRLNHDIPLCTAVLSLVTGFLVGGIPAWRIVSALRKNRSPGTESTANSAQSWSGLRDGLVVGEITLAFVLLVSAGLLTKSFVQLHRATIGFNSQSVLTMELSLPSAKYPTTDSMAEFFSTLAPRLAAIPDLSGVAFTSVLPLTGINNDRSFTVEGLPASASVPDEEFRVVTPNYFGVLQIPLLQGRDFTAADDQNAPPVLIVNEAFAQKYWPTTDTIGKRIRLNSPANAPWMRVVGVVGNIKHRDLKEPPSPEFYFPHAQNPSRLMTMVAKTKEQGTEMVSAIRTQLRSIDRDQPIANVRMMNRVVADSAAPRRLAAVLISLFAAIAVSFGATGVYGVISNVFLQRRRELAMRIALGAQRTAIVRLVFWKSFLLLASGLSIGLPLALLAGYELTPLLHRVTQGDPAIFFPALALLIATGLFATFIPARRAARLDPMQMLRCD
jgi:predicted permease